MIMANGSSSVSDAYTGTEASPASPTYLIPLLVVLGIVVLALTAVLITIFCRRKMRGTGMESSNSIQIHVIRSNAHKPLENELSICHSGVSFQVQSPNTKRKQDDIEAGYVDLSSALSGRLPDTEPVLPTIHKEKDINLSSVPAVTPTSHETPISANEEDAPEPLAPRPSLSLDCNETIREEPSTPTLPKIRSRRTGQPAKTPKGLLTDNKEATLKRASNLFRSDTKAHEFYTKTMTNYEMKREQLKSTKLIGRGHFGNVYIGEAAKLPNSKRRNATVAIKAIKQSAPDSEKQEFLYELEIMKLVNSLNHPNIIKLLGCVTDTQPYLIVLELMNNGNLHKFLRDTKSGETYYNIHGECKDGFSEHHLLKFALDIARGMEAIASLQLLHRDLATRNVLIDENLTCKVADFGFAKDILNKPEYKSKSVFQRPRPTRWLPPESLFTFKHGIQSDVWSYGIVLWEIVTMGNLPYPNMGTREVMKAVARGYRMPCPHYCAPDVYRVMADCWEEKPESRPTFTQIVEKMEQLLSKSADSSLPENSIIDMAKLHEDDYVDTLPPQEQEILLEYASSETLC